MHADAKGLVDGFVLDSAAFCLQDEAYSNADFRKVREYVIQSEKYGCYRKPNAPAFVLHAEQDTISSFELAERYVTLNNATHCYVELGEHLYAFSSKCIDELDGWFKDTFGWKTSSTRSWLAFTMRQVFTTVSGSFALFRRAFPFAPV